MLRARTILAYLGKVGIADRDRLVKEIKEPRTTIYDTLRKMRRGGWVGEIPIYRGVKGRPRIYWTITKKGREFVEPT